MNDIADLEPGHLHLNNRQRLFIRYVSFILVDLTVLNFFAEYWDLVSIDSFTASFIAAIILQVLLIGTFKLEHATAEYFKAMDSKAAKYYRVFCAWLILFLSKFVMLGAIEFLLGDDLSFAGPLHGVVAFITVVIAIVIAKKMLLQSGWQLESKESQS